MVVVAVAAVAAIVANVFVPLVVVPASAAVIVPFEVIRQRQAGKSCADDSDTVMTRMVVVIVFVVVAYIFVHMAHVDIAVRIVIHLHCDEIFLRTSI